MTKYQQDEPVVSPAPALGKRAGSHRLPPTRHHVEKLDGDAEHSTGDPDASSTSTPNTMTAPLWRGIGYGAPAISRQYTGACSVIAAISTSSSFARSCRRWRVAPRPFIGVVSSLV